MILVHVDDTLTAADTLKGVNAGKDVLSSKYKVRDMGKLRDFLGLNVMHDRSHKTLFLSAPGFTYALLEMFGMSMPNQTKVPMSVGPVLGRNESETLADKTVYTELIGSLLYLVTTTHSDLAYAAGGDGGMAEGRGRPNPAEPAGSRSHGRQR